MSSFSDMFKYFRYFGLIDTIVNLIEDIKDNDPPKKKAADIVKDLIEGMLPFIKNNNPKVADEIDKLAKQLSDYLDAYGRSDTVYPPPPPPPPVFPPPVISDPTTARYDTEAEGKAASTPAYPFVLLYEDGKYGVWPVVNLPAGAVKVFDGRT